MPSFLSKIHATTIDVKKERSYSGLIEIKDMLVDVKKAIEALDHDKLMPNHQEILKDIEPKVAELIKELRPYTVRIV